MISTTQNVIDVINSPVRKVEARVELFNNSTLVNTFKHNGKLISFDIDRAGDNSKFFGYGVCQKINIKLIDTSRELNITTANSCKAIYTISNEDLDTHPVFYVTEVHRDENTNELSITAYDLLYNAANRVVSELGLTTNYTIQEFAAACASLIGASGFTLVNDDVNRLFNISYENGANLEGTESIREVLDAIAEATQTIYFIDKDDKLVFKKLDKDGEAVVVISKANYFTLDSSTNRRLAEIKHCTSLGDNLGAGVIGLTGTTQYIRDNPFLEMREDVADILAIALLAMGGLTINQFSCEWRGNPVIEVADKLALTDKENNTFISYMLNDVISYNGSLSQKTSWSYEDNEEETEANPTTIGEALKQTYAKVDKVNKEITILASETEANKEAVAQLKLNTDSISTSVKSMGDSTQEAIDSLGDKLTELGTQITQTADKVDITITERISNLEADVKDIGYSFTTDGLTVNTTKSGVTTTITNDGMTVKDNNETMLTANSGGVNAVNLHANNYLIIDGKSRFEYIEATNHIGCFWIGT